MPGREPWEWAEYLGIGQGVEECTDCGGTGEIEDLTPVLYEDDSYEPGEWDDVPCRACRGRGWLCRVCWRPEGMCEHTRRNKQLTV